MMNPSDYEFDPFVCTDCSEAVAHQSSDGLIANLPIKGHEPRFGPSPAFNS